MPSFTLPGFCQKNKTYPTQEKFASLAFFPFGKEVVYGGGGFSFLVNLIWIIFFGLEMAIGYCILGCLWCITILGIPIGKQCFKMAKLSLMPFGASVV